MCCTESFPRRFFIIFLSFFGLLISIGFRTVFSLVMVHVISSTNSTDHTSDPTLGDCDPLVDYHNDWTVEHVSLLHTGYFIGSFIMQLPGGMLATRVSAKRVCGFSIMTSSILFMLLPVTIPRSYAGVMVIRVLQGLVEGVSIPAMNGVIAAWAPQESKSKMITFSYAGAYLSPAVALLSTGFSCCHFTWHGTLYIYGGLGVLWSLVWLLGITDRPILNKNLGLFERELYENERRTYPPTTTRTDVPVKAILTSLPVYAMFVGAFCRNWIFSILLMEQPQYFADAFNMDIASNGLRSAAPHCLMTCVVISGGIAFDKLIKSGTLSPTVARKCAQCLGFGVEAGCVLGLHFVDAQSKDKAFALLCAGVAVSGLAISGYQVNPLDLARPYASFLTGISRLGTLGAIISTFMVSQIAGRDHTIEEWQLVFLISAIIHFCGVLFYAIFASGERQLWAGPAPTPDDETEPFIQPAENLGQPTDYGGIQTTDDPARSVDRGVAEAATGGRHTRPSRRTRLSALEESLPIY